MAGERVTSCDYCSVPGSAAVEQRKCRPAHLAITHNAGGNQPDTQQLGRELSLPLERREERVFLEDTWAYLFAQFFHPLSS